MRRNREIKFGDIEYFTLLELERKLKARDLDRLGLVCVDKLRMEVYIKIQQINLEHNERIKIKKEKDENKN